MISSTQLFQSRQRNVISAPCTELHLSWLATHTHKHTHTERGSDLDVLKDQYIFTSMASDYPLPRCITVISRRLYCNSVQGQTVPSVACLLDISWKPLMLAVLMDTDWWGVIKCSRVSAGCDRMWPQRGRTEDLMALDKMCFKYISTYSRSREVIYIAGKHCGLVVCIVASQQEPHLGSISRWGFCTFSPCLCGFPPGTPVSSHSPETCRLG